MFCWSSRPPLKLRDHVVVHNTLSSPVSGQSMHIGCTARTCLRDALTGGIAARGNFTDKDIVDFLVNVECLEGLFDTWGTFGHGFIGACAGG